MHLQFPPVPAQHARALGEPPEVFVVVTIVVVGGLKRRQGAIEDVARHHLDRIQQPLGTGVQPHHLASDQILQPPQARPRWMRFHWAQKALGSPWGPFPVRPDALGARLDGVRPDARPRATDPIAPSVVGTVRPEPEPPRSELAGRSTAT